MAHCLSSTFKTDDFKIHPHALITLITHTLFLDWIHMRDSSLQNTFKQHHNMIMGQKESLKSDTDTPFKTICFDWFNAHNTFKLNFKLKIKPHQIKIFHAQTAFKYSTALRRFILSFTHINNTLIQFIFRHLSQSMHPINNFRCSQSSAHGLNDHKHTGR